MVAAGPRRGVFERLPIPTPFQVGDVNAYLAGRTLVDPGPDSDETWDALTTALAERDLAPGDVERVLITHPHPDHFGLAARLREAGATVMASPACADIVADFAGRLRHEQEFFVPFFTRHGMDESTAETVVELPEAYLPYAPDCEVDRRLTEGDTVAVADRDVSVLAVAGHAAGELAFTYDGPDGEVAIVGDQVLGDITPNPFLLPPPREGGDRPRVLPQFNRSLDRLADREFARILPGHREEIDAPTERIEEIRAAHEQRTDEVASIVDGPTTAVEVSEGLFGDLPATELFPGMSEAVGHLDVLEDRGRVRRRADDEWIAYEPA
jgi:glyoxylase-like metal-dependent hydrolase (beta-lactamase superfamily II)